MTTVDRSAQASLTRSRSRFLAFASPVASVEQAGAALEKLSRSCHDARHIAYAWRIVQEDRIDERSTDAGEPSGSAGAPLLQLLRGRELVNTLVAVVRYYGGIKLGIGNLARAYRDAASASLDLAGRREIVRTLLAEIRVAQDHIGQALAAVAQAGARVLGQGFVDGARIRVEVPADGLPGLERAVIPWGSLNRVEGDGDA